ncbi:MAG TPA: hypothetical protein VNY31_10760 [Solirubrobacteraceae bacterium]|jgi:hypothetical protein|nr:hypothetical protein [Solirubrobacteraceae bacterium]
MTSIRLIMLSMLAVFAIGAVAAAPASAFNDEWEVCQEVAGAGTEPPAKYDEHKCNTQAKPLAQRKWEWIKLVAGKEFTTESKKIGAAEFTLEVAGKSITCSAVTDKGSVTAGGKDEATKIIFTGCKTSTAGCEVKSVGNVNGTIEVTAIKTLLETVGGKLVDKFEQKTVGTTKEFVTLEFVGGTCAGGGFVKTKVKGDVAAECKNLANGNVELNFPNPAITQTPALEAFGLAAKLTGATEVALTNGWGSRCT